MNQKQREWLANKLGDLGNLATAIMLFGWVMAEPRPGPHWPILAGVIWFITHLAGFIILRRQ